VDPTRLEGRLTIKLLEYSLYGSRTTSIHFVRKEASITGWIASTYPPQVIVTLNLYLCSDISKDWMKLMLICGV